MTSQRECVITGDHNFHLDVAGDPNAFRFLAMLDGHWLDQQARQGILSRGGQTLAVLRDETFLLIGDPWVAEPLLCDKNCNLTCDHYNYSSKLTLSKPYRKSSIIGFRNLQDVKKDIVSTFVNIYILQ